MEVVTSAILLSQLKLKEDERIFIYFTTDELKMSLSMFQSKTRNLKTSGLCGLLKGQQTEVTNETPWSNISPLRLIWN